MSKPDYKPVPRVRMTLTANVQNRVVTQLLTAFGITETFNQKMEITCFPSDFATFMGLLGKMDKPPTIKQLQMEHVDVRRDVHRITVGQRGLACLFDAEPGDNDEPAEMPESLFETSVVIGELVKQYQPEVPNLSELPDAGVANAQNVRGYLIPSADLTPLQLSLRYPEGHPNFTEKMWQSRSMNCTSSGYWDWVHLKLRYES